MTQKPCFVVNTKGILTPKTCFVVNTKGILTPKTCFVVNTKRRNRVAAPFVSTTRGLIAWVLLDAKILTLQAVGDWLTVVFTAHIIVLGYEVVVHLLEVSLLIGQR